MMVKYFCAELHYRCLTSTHHDYLRCAVALQKAALFDVILPGTVKARQFCPDSQLPLTELDDLRSRKLIQGCKDAISNYSPRMAADVALQSAILVAAVGKHRKQNRHVDQDHEPTNARADRDADKPEVDVISMLAPEVF